MGGMAFVVSLEMPAEQLRGHCLVPAAAPDFPSSSKWPAIDQTFLC
jgi:hypothetical protein